MELTDKGRHVVAWLKAGASLPDAERLAARPVRWCWCDDVPRFNPHHFDSTRACPERRVAWTVRREYYRWAVYTPDGTWQAAFVPAGLTLAGPAHSEAMADAHRRARSDG